MGRVSAKKAGEILKKLLLELVEQNDIHLLMYCVHHTTPMKALGSNYKLLPSKVKKRVPIVLVVIGLEREEPEMEKWWKNNERSISDLGIVDHACITAAT